MATEGYFVIRAEVDAGLWLEFNRWYAEVHLPEAARRLGATEAFRLHDSSAEHVHVAVYRFADIASLDSDPVKTELETLIAEFNRAWPVGVARTRMMLQPVDHWKAAPGPST